MLSEQKIPKMIEIPQSISALNICCLDKLVLGLIITAHQNKNAFWLTNKEIGKYYNRSRTTISKSINRLHKENLINLLAGHNPSNNEETRRIILSNKMKLIIQNNNQKGNY